MAKKKTETKPKVQNTNAYIENAGVVIDQRVTDTLLENYMPYAMSVIVSRAIPEIDGFKPSHRKILYTMYKMGLLGPNRVKSANAVGEVMKLHPHGDMSLYETMVRLSKGNESLLHPFVDSKGNFGKSYSRDMAFAASRYTEVKLTSLCEELFRDIDKDTVDMVDNYDGTMKEPTLLPTTFPNILVNSNVGIAVGMASNICSFNLEELCNTTIELIRNPDHNIMDTLPAPDFVLGGDLIYAAEEMKKIYNTGRGSFKMRGHMTFDKSANCIEVSSIPPTTTIEAIIDKVVDLVKEGKIREISDIRDETDLKGLKIAIDLKRGADAEKVISKLYRYTPMEDSFSCNFNVLIGAVPMVLGVRDILFHWIDFRINCVKRRVSFELNKKKEKLHLLLGLEKILLDIDKAIRIVRETEEESEVVPNLMIGFGIDELQADYVAEIKLRHLNREFILKRTSEIEDLKKDIEDMEETLKKESKIKLIIINELKAVIKKYSQKRRTNIIYDYHEEKFTEEDTVEAYPVNLFYTSEGYFKKITPQSYRMSSEHKLKEGDEVITEILSNNRANLLFFTDKFQVYKSAASEFEDTKASVLGDFIPAKLGFDEGESPISMVVSDNYDGYMLFAFENGKIAKIPLSSYETKTKRKKLLKAYSDKSPLAGMVYIPKDDNVLLEASNGKVMLLDTARIAEKSLRDSQGVQVFTLRGKQTLKSIKIFADELQNSYRYTPKNIPSSGFTVKEDDGAEQMTL